MTSKGKDVTTIYKTIRLQAASKKKDEELKNLQQSLSRLENENEMLKEEVESML